MAKVNRLERDTRGAAAKARKVLADVGRIGESVDQVWLAEALGKLKDAVEYLDAAANYFERSGRDYPTADGGAR